MILNGECGTFNPILLECLKSIHEIVRHEYEKEASKSKGAEKTEDVVARQQQYEKTKEYFFKSISKDIISGNKNYIAFRQFLKILSRI